MRGFGCNGRTKSRETGRNAGVRARLRVGTVLVAGVPILSACMTSRPELMPPPPRSGMPPTTLLDTERAAAVEHRSVSMIRGDVRFLGTSGERPELGPIVVYLVPGAPEPVATSTEALAPVVITSRTPEFAPALAAVARGQQIVLANEGPLSHGLFSAEIAGRRFDLPPGTRSDPFTIPPRGPIRFYCALHSDETFVVFGGAVRHVTVVDVGQPFVFDSVAAGRYTLTIWSREVQGPVRDVFADGYTSPVEPIWIDPALVRRPLDPQDPT